jgi:hypothetical protein
VGLLAMAATGTKPLDFQGHGHFLPGHGDVWRIRLAGLVTIYTPVFNVYWSDALVSMLLVATGTTAGVVAALIRSLHGPDTGSLWRFHAVIGLGGIWLAFDETFSMHETIGYAIENTLGAPPFFHKPDDAVFAAYGAVAIAFTWLFRRIALEPGVPRRLVVSGLAFTLVLIAADLLDVPGEEYFEVLLAAFVLGAYLVLARGHLVR